MKKLLETFGEHGKDGKHQPDDLKRFIYDSKCSICDSKHFFWQPDASKHYSTMWTVKKIISYALGEPNPGSAQNWKTSSQM